MHKSKYSKVEPRFGAFDKSDPQRTKLKHALIIKKTLSFVGVDTNKVIILSVNKRYNASTPDKTEAMQLNHCHGDQ